MNVAVIVNGTPKGNNIGWATHEGRVRDVTGREECISVLPGDGTRVRTWPISIGRLEYETPLGRTTVVRNKSDAVESPPVDWGSVQAALAAANGVPTVVGKRTVERKLADTRSARRVLATSALKSRE